MKAKTTILLLALGLAFINRTSAQIVVLYDNSFESPNIPPTPNCGADLDATDLNTLWSGTAEGTGGGGSFQQVNTVETILVNGPDNQYEDPTGIGGNYCISMLSTAQDDRAALTLNSQLLPFAVINFNMSAIDIEACGGPFGVDTPSMNIKIHDSPGAVFNFYTPGPLLDETTLTGIQPGATIYTFNWSQQSVSLDISGATDGNITVVFNLTQSGYAAIDNLVILSSISGIEESTGQHHLSIYPNPAAGEFHFTFNSEFTGQAHLELINPIGQMVYTEEIHSVSGKITGKINPPELHGLHLVRMKAGDQLLEERIFFL